MHRRQLLMGALGACLIPLARARASREPVVGQPCEGCEAVFDGAPTTFSSRARIAPVNEPGQSLSLSGTVLDLQGRPRCGVIVYAYHTDQAGIYPTPAFPISPEVRRHGRLRAWVKTDEHGGYRFDTIRPGHYPGRDLPEHIHMHVIEPGIATYYIDDVMFLDDPKLTREQIARLTLGRGGSGISMPRQSNGRWLVRRDIILGLRIPGYPA